MTILLIILLILIIIYLAYQNRKLQTSSDNSAFANSPHKIFELDEDLIADRDLAIRERNEAQAESLALNNRLKLKNQEVSRKDQEIEGLKQEKSQVEIALNGKIKELKEKYSKQGKLLDEESLENNKLTEKIEQLEAKIKELEKQNLPGSFPEENKDD